MTRRNAEFIGEFNEIQLKIQIEVKMRGRKENKRHLQEKIRVY